MTQTKHSKLTQQSVLYLALLLLPHLFTLLFTRNYQNNIQGPFFCYTQILKNFTDFEFSLKNGIHWNPSIIDNVGLTIFFAT